MSDELVWCGSCGRYWWREWSLSAVECDHSRDKPWSSVLTTLSPSGDVIVPGDDWQEDDWAGKS